MSRRWSADGDTIVRYGQERTCGLVSDLDGVVSPGARVWVLADAALSASHGLSRICADLRQSGCDVCIDASIKGEPRFHHIEQVICTGRQLAPDVIVAVGGGSAIDMGKFAAALIMNSHDLRMQLQADGSLPATRLPLIAIPTTAGTGAEVTRSAAFRDTDGQKLWASGADLNPDFAILDPSLTVALPRSLTLSTAVDALVHAIEATTNRRVGPGIDLPAMAAISLIRSYLPAALAKPDNMEARSALLRASCLSGQAVERAGTGVAHALGHAIEGLIDIPHGAATGIGLQAAIGWNAAESLGAHAAVADAFGVILEPDASDEAKCNALAAEIRSFLSKVGFSSDLSPMGLTTKDADRIADALMSPANATMREVNCRTVDHHAAQALSRSLFC